MNYEPVCFKNGTEAAYNQCVATTKPELDGADYARKYCSQHVSSVLPLPEDKPVKDVNVSRSLDQCLCPFIYMPICSEDGSQKYSNLCEADCVGADLNLFKEEWCPPEQFAPEQPDSPVVVEPESQTPPVKEPECDCPAPGVAKPACSKDKSQSVPSLCLAECYGLKAGIDVDEEWCPGAKPQEAARVLDEEDEPEDEEEEDEEEEDEDEEGDEGDDEKDDEEDETGKQRSRPHSCGCRNTWKPVCLLDGTFVSASKCIADCHNLAGGMKYVLCTETSWKPKSQLNQ